MTVTALATPDDLIWSATRAALGEVHATWCATPPSCSGACRQITAIGEATVVLNLPYGADRPVVTITSPAGVVVLDADTAEQVCRQVLPAVAPEVNPHPGLRRQ